jgi:hypothetical protein
VILPARVTFIQAFQSYQFVIQRRHISNFQRVKPIFLQKFVRAAEFAKSLLKPL